MPPRYQKVNCKKCLKSFFKCKNQIKQTNGNNFCSRSCSCSYHNTGTQRHKPKNRICKRCSANFISTKTHISKNLCKVCLTAYHSHGITHLGKCTLKEYRQKLSVAGKHPSWANTHVRGFNRIWNKNLTKLPCANCGYTKHVELAHIKAVTSFPDTATLGEVNHPTNIVQLCRNCHWEFDNGLIVLN